MIGEEDDFGQIFELLKCSACGSVSIYPDLNRDYTEYTTSDIDLREYVELNVSIEWLAVNIMSVVAGRKPGRLLDVGCGYGFSADVAKQLAGWDVLGVDPSAYGAIGAKALKLDILQDIIDDKHPIMAQTFDVIHSSEVLEHVSDPFELISLKKRMLAEGGLLVLTTPNAGALDTPIAKTTRYSILSLRNHLILFTQASLAALLRRAGFRNVEVEIRGETLVAFASNASVARTAPQPTQLGLQYCEAVLAKGVDDDYLNAGLQFRRYRFLVELGQFEQASQYASQYEAVDETHVPCASREDFAAHYRIFAGIVLFYVGIMKLNYKTDVPAAREAFRKSYIICGERCRLFEMSALFDQNLMWRSLLHVAVSDEMLGQHEAARDTYRSIIASGENVGLGVPLDIVARAKASLQALG